MPESYLYNAPPFVVNNFYVSGNEFKSAAHFGGASAQTLQDRMISTAEQ